MKLDRRPAVFDHMTALADGIRSRMLLLLEQHELTVSEVCSVIQLPQSTASRHLKVLGDDGWVRSRRNGTKRLYRMDPDDLEPEAKQLWELIRESVARQPSSAHDARRLEDVLDRRRSRSQEFFSSAAGGWDRMRDELFGRRFYLIGLLGLLDDRWTVGDLGCGTGRIAGSLAPFVERVIAVDDSGSMLGAARDRLAAMPNVDLRRGELEALPIEDGTLDAATLVLVLHHVGAPAKVLAEVHRVLRPGGRLLVVDMLPHDRVEYQRKMGHVWMGFSQDGLEELAHEAGLAPRGFDPLPADPEAKGPVLFAASLCKPDGARSEREDNHDDRGTPRKRSRR